MVLGQRLALNNSGSFEAIFFSSKICFIAHRRGVEFVRYLSSMMLKLIGIEIFFDKSQLHNSQKEMLTKRLHNAINVLFRQMAQSKLPSKQQSEGKPLNETSVKRISEKIVCRVTRVLN